MAVHSQRNSTMFRESPLSPEPEKNDNNIKETIAEERRQRALSEKIYDYFKKRNLISQALRGELKGGQATESFEGHPSNKKRLFDEQSEDSDECKIEFKPKKSKKFLDLQSKLAADDRFIMDEKFYEDEDHDAEEGVSTEKTAPETERELNVLESILGSLPPSHKSTKRYNIVTNMRYDPTNEHSNEMEYCDDEAGPDTYHDNVNADNKVKDGGKMLCNSAEEVPVSKSKFYNVNNELISNLKRDNPTNFSLLQTFGDPIDGEVKNDDYTCAPVKRMRNTGTENPFRYDSSQSEDEEEKELPAGNKHTFSNPTAQENRSFFFKDDEECIKEGFKLFMDGSYSNVESFADKRAHLREIVKKKIKKNPREQTKQKFIRKKRNYFSKK